MLFANTQKWSSKEVRYERGAWLRVYGVPVHAWNVSFFRLCVLGIGRFILADECTVNKARMDFARILVSTPQIEIVNKLAEFLIDGTKFNIKLVEKWGCNLGEDAFMTEVESDSTPEGIIQPNDVDDLDEVQGEWELDELVDDLHKEWSHHEEKKRSTVLSPTRRSPGIVVNGQEIKFFEVNVSQVTQPLGKSPMNEVMGPNTTLFTDPPAAPKVTINNGPWSVDWLVNRKSIQDGGDVFSATCNVNKNKVGNLATTQFNSSQPIDLSQSNKSGRAKNTVGFMKRIACMPAADRKHILKLLKKQKQKQKVSAASKKGQAAVNSSLNSSNNSSSVNKDWENWVVLHGKGQGVAADVRNLGKAVGVKYQCDTLNSFDLLTREGRREWRAVVGGELVGGRSKWVFW